jgi:hypothetical protein
MDINTEPIKQELAKISAWVAPITNNQDYKFQSDNLKTVKFKIKEIEEQRTRIVKPINDSVAKINAIFKPFIDDYKRLKEIMERNILDYSKIELARQQEEERKLREIETQRLMVEQKRLEDEALKNNSEFDINEAIKLEQRIEAVESRPSDVRAGINGDWAKTRIKSNWTYDLIDSNEVPHEFCSPDHNKIMAQIKSGIREIPGVKIFNKGSVASF